MTITKRVVYFPGSDEVQPNGVLQLRFNKEVLKDGKVISAEYHRTVLTPGTSLAAQVALVTSHLSGMKFSEGHLIHMRKQGLTAAEIT